MRRLLTALIVGVAGGLCVGLTTSLGQQYAPLAIVGALLGAALALVPRHHWRGRAFAFILGWIIGVICTVTRGLVVPQNDTWRGVMAFVMILLIGVVAAVSKGRLPMWAGLLGAATFVGGYEQRFGMEPTLATSELLLFSAPVLATAAITYIAGMLSTLLFGEDDDDVELHRPVVADVGPAVIHDGPVTPVVAAHHADATRHVTGDTQQFTPVRTPEVHK